MGKSTTAAMFAEMGVPVQDADREVHKLMAQGGAAVPVIENVFPGVVQNGAVDRAALGQRVFGDDSALKKLESILHPMVAARRTGFLRRAAQRGKSLAVLDIPLLFETAGDRNCDLTVLVSAPHFVQSARFLQRPGMTSERLAAIRSKQMSDSAKRRLADIVILTGDGKGSVRRAVQGIVRRYSGKRGTVWPPAGQHARPGFKRPIILSSLRKV